MAVRRECLIWLLALISGAALAVSCRQAQEEGPWVASARGEAYYWAECRAAGRLAPQNRIYFSSAEEAREAGYRPSNARGCQGPVSAVDTASRPEPEALGLASSGAASLPRNTRPCTIEQVSDGDTVVCEDGERVRLLLVDTPEKGQAPFGERAREALRGMVPPGTTVHLEPDAQPEDRYGRTLAYLWLPQGQMVNERLVQAGYAVPLVYPPNVKYVDRIRAAAAEAQRKRRGLWRTNAFECLPRDYRAGRCE